MIGVFEGFSWAHPLWLAGLAVVPLAGALYFHAERRRQTLLRALVAARLQPALAGSVHLGRRRAQMALTLGALACCIVALAGPRYGFTTEEAKRKGRDVLIAIDTSRSMLANDVAPSRLERSKLAAQDLIGTLQGDRVGIIAFAGASFLQAPLTVDYGAALASLQELDTNIIPKGGTNLSEAIHAAVEAFGKGESESRCLVLFTDGEDLAEDAVKAAKAAAGTMTIFTVGVGTGDGSLISVPTENGGTELVKGPDGNFVKSRLDEARLRQIAEATGGFYVHLQNGPSEMRRLVSEGLEKLKENEIDTRMARRPIERYPWPLALGIVLLVVAQGLHDRKKSGRRGGAAVALLLLGLAQAPAQAQAGTVTPEALYQEGKYQEAHDRYETLLKRRPDSSALQFNKGTTDYALGEYDAAIASFGEALTTRDPKLRALAEYNLGTALLQRALQRDESKEEEPRKADLTNAIQHLDEALKLNPKQEDAAANKAVAHRELTKPKPTPPPQQQNQNDQQSKDQQSKDQQSKDQQSKDQQSKDQQSKDQQSKDQQSKDQQSKGEQSKGEPTPTPGPTPSGKIQAAPSGGQAGEKAGEEAQAELETTGSNGEMSPSQARLLLESTKDEEAHPFKPEQRSGDRVWKDW